MRIAKNVICVRIAQISLMAMYYKIVLIVIMLHYIVGAPTVVIVIAVIIAQIVISAMAVLNVLGVLTVNGALVSVSNMTKCI